MSVLGLPALRPGRVVFRERVSVRFYRPPRPPSYVYIWDKVRNLFPTYLLS
jgi:hypothetical protein